MTVIVNIGIVETYVLLKAETDCQWDTCDFAIMDLATIDLTKFSDRIELVKQAAKDEGFSAISYSYWGGGFFVDVLNKAGQWTTDGLLPPDKKWAFIPDLNFDLQPPLSKLTALEIIFTAEGAYFAADCKHTGDRFWTEVIPMPVLEQFISESVAASQFS